VGFHVKNYEILIVMIFGHFKGKQSPMDQKLFWEGLDGKSC